jgi:hypothetical protein
MDPSNRFDDEARRIGRLLDYYATPGSGFSGAAASGGTAVNNPVASALDLHHRYGNFLPLQRPDFSSRRGIDSTLAAYGLGFNPYAHAPSASSAAPAASSSFLEDPTNTLEQERRIIASELLAQRNALALSSSRTSQLGSLFAGLGASQAATALQTLDSPVQLTLRESQIAIGGDVRTYAKSRGTTSASKFAGEDSKPSSLPLPTKSAQVGVNSFPLPSPAGSRPVTLSGSDSRLKALWDMLPKRISATDSRDLIGREFFARMISNPDVTGRNLDALIKRLSSDGDHAASRKRKR